MTEETRKTIEKAQQLEITEYYIYSRLAKKTKDKKNAKTLLKIAKEEKRHAQIWKKYTKKEIKPLFWNALFFYWVARILGLTFGIKLLERGEEAAQIHYDELAAEVPEAKQISEDENAHEKMLIEMLEEEKLDYMGSIVLGLNDALVELTGALAGLTFALQNTRLTAIAGLITGVAASFSMAASEYLSTKAEGNSEKSLKSAVYTGIAYIFTVALLVLPYFLFTHYLLCLGMTMAIALLIIFLFNYYISVAKDLNFMHRFLEMAILSMGVAAITFGIGFVIRTFVGVDI